MQLAKAMGAGTVIGAGRGEKSEQVARIAGCDRFIDLNMDNPRDGLRDAVHAVTAGKGVDIVIDPIGGNATASALRAMAWRGRLVVVGFATGDIPTFRANYLLVRNVSVAGLQWSDYRQRDPALVHRVQIAIFDLWAQGKLLPVISDRLPLADFGVALNRLKQGRAKGRIILLPD